MSRYKRQICFFLIVIFGPSLAFSIQDLQKNHPFNKNWTTTHDPFYAHAIPKCGVFQMRRLCHLLTSQQLRFQTINQILRKKFNEQHNVMMTCETFTPNALEILKSTPYKMIVIIRDPRDALISQVHYMRLFGMRKNSSKRRDFFSVGADFDTISLDQQITSLIQGDEHAESYIDYYKQRLGWALSGYAHIIKYEDIAGSAGNQLSDETQQAQQDEIKLQTIRKLANYLNMNLSDDHLQYIFDNLYYNQTPYAGIKPPVDGQDIMDSQIYKRASTGQWKNFLNESHKLLLKATVGEELIQLGYESDFNW